MWRRLIRTLAPLATLALVGLCGSTAVSTDDLRTGEPVEWPAPTEPGFTPPTYDRTQDRGIWGSGR